MWNSTAVVPGGRWCLTRSWLVSDFRQLTFTKMLEKQASSSGCTSAGACTTPLRMASSSTSVLGEYQLDTASTLVSDGLSVDWRASAAILRPNDRKLLTTSAFAAAVRAPATISATGEMSRPTARRPASRASTRTVPPPQNGSKTLVPGSASMNAFAANGCKPAG